jgi:hypothetical protein
MSFLKHSLTDRARRNARAGMIAFEVMFNSEKESGYAVSVKPCFGFGESDSINPCTALNLMALNKHHNIFSICRIVSSIKTRLLAAIDISAYTPRIVHTSLLMDSS